LGDRNCVSSGAEPGTGLERSKDPHTQTREDSPMITSVVSTATRLSLAPARLAGRLAGSLLGELRGNGATSRRGSDHTASEHHTQRGG
jgi:hypothetical protein